MKYMKQIEEEAEKLGWEREKRGFSPHITIGRVKGNINIAIKGYYASTLNLALFESRGLKCIF